MLIWLMVNNRGPLVFFGLVSSVHFTWNSLINIYHTISDICYHVTSYHCVLSVTYVAVVLSV